MIERNPSNFESLRLFAETELRQGQWNVQRTRDFLVQNNTQEFRTAMEHAFRSILFTLIEQQMESNVDAMETSSAIDSHFLMDIRTLIGHAIDAVHNELASPTMPVYLFNDLFTYTTIDMSENIFILMEEKAMIWRSPIFFASVKNVLLRMCNDLLKRLSKTQKTVFSGRILTFLAQLFPLNEKSGLNQIGNFNIENVTKWTKSKSLPSATEEIEKERKMDVDEDGEIDDIHQKSSTEFYTNFWSLQDFFSRPFDLWETTAWNTFVHNTNQTLDVFSINQLDNIQTVSSSSDAFFAKYLTSEKLLELQLNDVTFRQNILVQLLIIFQYLTIPVKFKQTNQILREDQSQWVKKTTQHIYALLKKTGANAELFTSCIQHILKREEMWNLWKNNGCPDFSKSRIDLTKNASNNSFVLSENIRQSIQQASKRRAMNFEDLRSPTQEFIPSIREFFEPLIEQFQSFPATKEGEKERERILQQDPSLIWRALRLLARQSPYFFVHNTQTVPSMAQFIVSTCEKIRREFISAATISTANSTAAAMSIAAAATPPPVTSTTNNDDDDEDTTMDDEPIENLPSAAETNHIEHDNDEEPASSTNAAPQNKLEEDDDDDNRERRFASIKRTST